MRGLPPTSLVGDNGYRYLVVSRQRTRRFDPERDIAIETRSHPRFTCTRWWMRTEAEDAAVLYSEERAKKEEGIARRFAERFESELRKLHEELSRPRTRKGLDSVWQRIGRIQDLPRCRAALQTSSPTRTAPRLAVTWKPQAPCRHHAHPSGVSTVYAAVHDWDPQTLWRTYTMLTDLEAVFRSLKSELGLRPSSTRPRTVPTASPSCGPDHPQTPRRTRRERQLDHSASYPRRPAPGHRFLPPKGRAPCTCARLTRAEQRQLKIYTALDLHPAPGGVTKLIV